MKGGEEGLSMIATYTDIENALGVHLRYLQIMQEWLMLPGMRDKSLTGRIGVCIEGCNTMASILEDVSGWFRIPPRDNNVSVEWCMLGESR